MMDSYEMIALCANKIGLFGPEAEFVLVMPGRRGQRNSKRLISGDRKSPKGEILPNDVGYAHVAVMFKAKEVLQYLTKETAPNA